MELIAKLSRTESQRGFSPKYLVYFEEMFRRHAGEQKELNLDQFKKIIQSKNTFFSERVFQLYDTDNLGSISLEKFLQGIKKFAIQKPEEKLKSIFDIYDIDGDGFLQPSELDMVVKECMQENGLTFTDVQLQDLVMTLFEEADVDKSGVISFEKFRAQLNRHPGLIENLSISAEKQLLPPSQENVTGRFQDYLPSKLRWRYIRNNYISAVFLFIYLAINLILFVSRSLQVSKMKDTSLNILAKFEYLNNLTHRERKYNITEEAMLEDYPRKFTFEVLARASGQCLNFTCMFIVLPVLRRSLTFLRERGFSDYLPLDQGIYFHKLTGWFILFYSVLHTIMHICNFTRISNGNRHLAAWLLFSTETGIGWVKGSACITGWILLVILITMVICALNCIRRRGMFEIFYYTHLLYLAFWIILLLHGPNFWKWFLGPALLFLVETLMKIQMSFSKRGKTCVIKGILLPSKVIHLIIKRPRHFEFQPGDYVFIKIPSITQFEWHPFTISSAPEQEDVLWLHIRTVGEWTSQLWNYFDKPFFLNQRNDDNHSCIFRHQQFSNTNKNGVDDVAVSLSKHPNIVSTISKDHKIECVSSFKSGIINLGFTNDDKKQEEETEETIDKNLISTLTENLHSKTGIESPPPEQQMAKQHSEENATEYISCPGNTLELECKDKQDNRSNKQMKHGLSTVLEEDNSDDISEGYEKCDEKLSLENYNNDSQLQNNTHSEIPLYGGEINEHHLQVQTQSNAFPFLESDTHNNVSQSQTHCVTFPLSESDTHEIGSHDETHCSAFYLPESNTNDNGSKKQRYNYETLLLEGTNVQGSQNQKQSVSIRLPKDDVSKSQVKNNESPICKDDDNNSKHKSCSQTEHDAQIVNESGNNYTTVSDKSAEHFDIPDTVFLSIPEENKKRKMMRTISAPAPHKSISPRLIREGTNTCRPQMNERSLSAPAVPQGFKRTLPTILLPVLQENKDEEEIAGLVPPLSYETLQLEDVFKMSKPLKLTVEGPYGSPTRQIFRSQHAVLIATGIGVTPFASILQSIMMRYRHARMKCPKCNHQWVNQVPHSIHNLRKVDFIWINRDQRSFEWFVNLLSELEIQQAEDGDIMERFLDIHMFITSALRKNDIKALGLQMALDLLHEKSKRCLITGLKTRTQPGRPDWNKVFQELADQRKGKVSVFYCGPPYLGKILHAKCNEYGFCFKKETF